MTYSVIPIPNGKWKQNCYLVADNSTGLSLVIDPGSDAHSIRLQLLHHSLTPVVILNTHAHYDHIGAVADLMESYKVPFFLNQADVKLMKQANIYKFLFDSKESVVIPENSHHLSDDGGILKFAGFDVSVFCTPGHTKGSTCLKIGTNLFSGDTLLPNGLGRTDLPGGDKFALAQSVDLLRSLPFETKVWPGHGHSFSLGSLWEKLSQAGRPN
jgi:glyoxylase-like metal-dependent hydrolase (beta-lactamase superfamily II)